MKNIVVITSLLIALIIAQLMFNYLIGPILLVYIDKTPIYSIMSGLTFAVAVSVDLLILVKYKFLDITS